MPRDELTISAEQEDIKAFDDAWNEDVTDDDFEYEDDGDTSDEEAAEGDEFEGDTDDELDESEDDDQADENTNKEDESKEQQRYKSWEGRLKAEENRLKAEREEFERKQKEGQQQKEPQSDDEQDTDDSPDEFEEEFPEVADYLKKHIQPLREQLTQSQIEQQRKAEEAHINRIVASHPDALEVAQSDSFKSWIEDQPYKKATEYVHIQQNGTPEQVIAMLDDFKQHKPNKPRPNSASSVVKTRRTAKPRGHVAKDDFDGAWEEANRQ